MSVAIFKVKMKKKRRTKGSPQTAGSRSRNIATNKVQVTSRLTISQPVSWRRAPTGTTHQLIVEGLNFTIKSRHMASSLPDGGCVSRHLCLVYTYVHFYCMCIFKVYISVSTIYAWPISVQALHRALSISSPALCYDSFSHMNNCTLERRQVYHIFCVGLRLVQCC
jgi:hypothetical protein